jgi:RNA polymerase sigma-70 factor (ECF subfamily)
MKHSEIHIVQQLREKDKQVIEQLYDQYSAVLFGIILKIVQSNEVAEDALQESFVKIWSNGSSYDSAKGTIFTWMLNIARNTAIDKVRAANGKKKAQLSDYNALLGKEGQHPSAELQIDQIGLIQVVDGLEEKYREMIDLIYFKGYTQEEISQELGMPLGTVKSRLRIAIRELRRVFGSPLIGIVGMVAFWTICTTKPIRAILEAYFFG